VGNTPGYGGEQVSLDIESHITDDFHGAKYTEIKTNESYVGGLVRQFDKLSFSRVYNAGHEGKAATFLSNTRRGP
jgi:hypothetical protein